jgi:hypothetical protein
MVDFYFFGDALPEKFEKESIVFFNVNTDQVRVLWVKINKTDQDDEMFLYLINPIKDDTKRVNKNVVNELSKIKALGEVEDLSSKIIISSNCTKVTSLGRREKTEKQKKEKQKQISIQEKTEKLNANSKKKKGGQFLSLMVTLMRFFICEKAREIPWYAWEIKTSCENRNVKIFSFLTKNQSNNKMISRNQHHTEQSFFF